jgi:hypothetical protein
MGSQKAGEFYVCIISIEETVDWRHGNGKLQFCKPLVSFPRVPAGNGTPITPLSPGACLRVAASAKAGERVGEGSEGRCSSP